MKASTMIALLLCGSSLGCSGPLSFTPTNSRIARPEPRPVDAVAVFAAAKPDRPFTEIGIIEYATDDRPVEHLRQKGAELGCDGIVLLPNDDKVVGVVVVGTGTVLTADRYRASCIVFDTRGNG